MGTDDYEDTPWRGREERGRLEIKEMGAEGLEVKATNDMDAAMKLRAGQADY